MSLNPLVGGNFAHTEAVPLQTSPLLTRFSLKGKTAIVTGAGAGIGLSVARGFAELGANVIIWFNSNEAAHQRAAEIEKEFGVKCNIPSSMSIQFAAAEKSVNRQSIQSPDS
jgi:sorbose reductase